MSQKPAHASGYGREQIERVRATCLYLATKLGDLLEDMVIVGGLVPSLIISQQGREAQELTSRHVGTFDLDCGLHIALLDTERYEALVERLKLAGFAEDPNEKGNPARFRWRIDADGTNVQVDFLIPPSQRDDKGGKLRQITPEFAAVITPGLELAFQDWLPVTIDGVTIKGERATRTLRVCGPGAFVVLKALAVRGRGDNKDAYDLFYVLRNYGAGMPDVLARAAPLLSHDRAREALDILRSDFMEIDRIGPMRVAEFITGRRDDGIQQDVVGQVTIFLKGCGAL